MEISQDMFNGRCDRALSAIEAATVSLCRGKARVPSARAGTAARTTTYRQRRGNVAVLPEGPPVQSIASNLHLASAEPLPAAWRRKVLRRVPCLRDRRPAGTDRSAREGLDRVGEVHVVDADEGSRSSAFLLLRSAGIPVITHGSAQALLDSLSPLRKARIGCVLAELHLPDTGALELLHQLQAQGLQRPVIVMTAHGGVSAAVQTLKAGAADFIQKPLDREALLTAIRTASSQPEYLEAAARLATLTPQERGVLKLLVSGATNRMAAEALGLSCRTVEVHRARAMERLKVRSLATAIRLSLLAEHGPHR